MSGAQRGVCVVRRSVGSTEDIASLANARSLKVVFSDGIPVDMIVTVHGLAGQAYVIPGNHLALLQEPGAAAAFCERLLKASGGFRYLTVLLPEVVAGQQQVLEACTRMQLEYNHRVIWLMQGQGPVQLALDLALAAQSAEERSAAVTEQWREQVSSWNCMARALQAVRFSSDNTAPTSLTQRQIADISVCGSLVHIANTTPDVIASTSGCALPQARAFADFWANETS